MKKFYKGTDISSIEEVEAAGLKFYDHGKEKELFSILSSYKVNAIRLRLWVDPYDENRDPYLGGTSDFNSLIRIAKRAKQAKMEILLDYHYSDFWVDAGKQMLPKAWRNLSLTELIQKVYDYTKETLIALHNEGIDPEMIQVGNEITNGMLWPIGKLNFVDKSSVRTGYDNFAKLVNAGIKAVKEIMPNAKIVLHLERSCDNAVYHEWLDEMIKRGVDFDILGISYYSFWHGKISELEANIEDIKKCYGKDIMIVETSYAFTLEDFDSSLRPSNYVGLAMSQKTIKPVIDHIEYPLTRQGQKDFFIALLDVCTRQDIKGLFYWEPAWLPSLGTGWASTAAQIYINQIKGLGNDSANQCLFDYQGNILDAFEIIKNYKGKIDE